MLFFSPLFALFPHTLDSDEILIVVCRMALIYMVDVYLDKVSNVLQCLKREYLVYLSYKAKRTMTLGCMVITIDTLIRY